MNLIKNFLFLFITISLSACADYQIDKSNNSKTRNYYSSNGFALIYDDSFFEKGIINKKLNNDEIVVMHSFLKMNTYVKIINPENSIFVETKIYIKANYPKLFNIVVSKKIADILKLDMNNPYIEVLEIKKNKTFIAKKSDMFEEEKKVAEIAPVNDVEIDILTESEISDKNTKDSNFTIFISDFYYLDSANNLKKELFKQTKINNFSVKKISNNKYRLLVGPFKNFEALKSTYISLNNLGFEEINVYRD